MATFTVTLSCSLDNFRRAGTGTCPGTCAYAERRTAEGKSKAEIIRCLKRYVAREVYRHLRPAAG